MKILRLFVGLALLPLCYAATWTLFVLLRIYATQEPGGVPFPGLAMLTGLSLWLFLYWLLPRPVKAYVLAHELTHALWALLSGEKVSRLRASGSGGSVMVTNPNVIVILAPYFFPLYTMLVVAVYGLVSLFCDLRAWRLLWLALVGLTWSFHATFTVDALRREQSDIRRCGRVFSYTLIYLVNLAGLGLWLVATGAPTLGQLGRLWLGHALAAWRWTGWVLGHAWSWAYNKIAALSVM